MHIRIPRFKFDSRKVLSTFVITAIVITSALGILYLFRPVLIGAYVTSSGTIEYFRNILDPEFVIKPYFNGSQVPALISVYVNEPHEVKFLENSFTSTLKVSFSSLLKYVTPWEKYKNVNTSLLIFATYFNGSKAYTQAEEIPYDPSWIIQNSPIQIVATINIKPTKTLTINTTQLLGIKKEKSVFIAPQRGGYKYAYIINETTNCAIEPPVYSSEDLSIF